MWTLIHAIDIDILEEFAYLRSVEGGKVSMDILSAATAAAIQ